MAREIFIPIICLFINVLTQIFIFRYFKRISLLKSVYLGFSIGLISIIIFEFCNFFIFQTVIKLKDSIAIFITNLITYFSLGYCYFHFINLGETARRIRILRELYDSAEGLSPEEVYNRYNAKEIIDRRLTRLSDTKQIICKDGKYYIANPMVLYIAKIIIKMKLILLGRDRENITV